MLFLICMGEKCINETLIKIDATFEYFYFRSIEHMKGVL